MPYSGELVAGVNPQEQAGIGGINQYANAAQPYLNAAAGYANSAAAPVSQQQIQSYENPYTSQVLGSTEQQMALLNAQQNQNVVGNAISSGAWGGDRASVAQAQLAGQQSSAEAPVLAGIASQGYQTGLSTALTEQQQQAQAAYSLGNIGQGVQSAGLTGAGAQIQGGQLQQGTQQQLDTAQMQQYYTAMGYPFQTASWLAGIEGGIGGVAGGTSSTTAPPPNPLNALIGGAATVAGAYLGKARGGGIPHFDGGGATPYSGGISFIPQPTSAGRGTMNPSAMLASANRQQPGQQQPIPGMGNLGAGLGKRFGSNGIDTSGAGSGFPLEGSVDASVNYGPSAAMGFGDGPIYATGGGVGPQQAGLGFADGGDPNDGSILSQDRDQANKDALAAGRYYQDDRGNMQIIPPGGVKRNVPLPRPRPPGFADGGDPTFADQWASLADTPHAPLSADDVVSNSPFTPPPDVARGISAAVPMPVPRPNVGYSGSDMPAGFSLNADTLGETGTGHPPGFDGTQTAGVVPSRPGIGAAAYAPPGINAPNGLNPNGGVGSSAPSPFDPSSLMPAADNRTFGQKISLPLMQAGLAMMASRSPFVGEAIGQGGLSGIGAYVAQEHEQHNVAEKQTDIALKAKQLSDLAEQHRNSLAQQEKHQQQQFGLETRKQDFTENQPVSISMGGTLVNRGTGQVIASNTASTLDPAAIEILGRRLAGGDATALSGLPQGTPGAAARTAIQNKAAEVLTKEGGMSPTDAASTVTSRSQQVHAEGLGLGAGARTEATREANLGIILRTTDAAIPAALEASKNVARTGWVPINQIIQKGEVIASNPDLKSFGMANLQLAEGWARAMNPTGVMRESDRDKALSFLSTADSPQTYERAVTQLRTQIQRELNAVHAQKPATPGGTAPSEAPAGGASPAAPERHIQRGYIYERQPDGGMKAIGPAPAAP